LSYNISIGGFYGRMLKNDISFKYRNEILDTLKNDFGSIFIPVLKYFRFPFK